MFYKQPRIRRFIVKFGTFPLQLVDLISSLNHFMTYFIKLFFMAWNQCFVEYEIGIEKTKTTPATFYDLQQVK